MENDLEKRLKAGEIEVFAEVFTQHRARIWQIVNFRINDHIRGRVDPDDVVQDIYLAAEKRLKYFVEGNFPTIFLWLRLVAVQTLSNVHRKHLGTESRTALKEISMTGEKRWDHTSFCLSQRFIAHMSTPSQAVARGELATQIREALDTMNETDREILALRHFEELTNREVALELGISPKASSIRYIRALEKLRHILKHV